MFDLTHTLTADFGSVAWRRVSLPCAGGVLEQPARLMEALVWIGQQRNRLLAQQRRPRGRRTRGARNDG